MVTSWPSSSGKRLPSGSSRKGNWRPPPSTLWLEVVKLDVAGLLASCVRPLRGLALAAGMEKEPKAPGVRSVEAPTPARLKLPRLIVTSEPTLMPLMIVMRSRTSVMAPMNCVSARPVSDASVSMVTGSAEGSTSCTRSVMTGSGAVRASMTGWSGSVTVWMASMMGPTKRLKNSPMLTVMSLNATEGEPREALVIVQSTTRLAPSDGKLASGPKRSVSSRSRWAVALNCALTICAGVAPISSLKESLPLPLPEGGSRRSSWKLALRRVGLAGLSRALASRMSRRPEASKPGTVAEASSVRSLRLFVRSKYAPPSATLRPKTRFMLQPSWRLTDPSSVRPMASRPRSKPV